MIHEFDGDEWSDPDSHPTAAPFDYGSFIERIRAAEAIRSQPERERAQVHAVNEFLPQDVAAIGGWKCVSAVRVFAPGPGIDVCWVTLQDYTGDRVRAPGDHFSQAVVEAIEIVREDKMKRSDGE